MSISSKFDGGEGHAEGQAIVSKNGTTLFCEVALQWAQEQGVERHYILPG